MATVQETIKSTNDSALELITSIQQRIVDAQQELAATVAGLVPDVPSWVPAVDASDAPSAKSLVEESFAFQARLLEANKTFAVGLIDAWAQAAPKPAEAPKSSSTKK